MKKNKSQNIRISIRSALLLNCFILSYGWAVPLVIKINDTIVDPQARTITGSYGQAINGLSFQQEAITTHNGFQYATYYNQSRHVCIARRELPSGPWEITELTDYTTSTNDAHDVISMGICPNDGTIHLAFDHHRSTLNYRIPKYAGSIGGADCRNKSVRCNLERFDFRPGTKLSGGREKSHRPDLSEVLANTRRQYANELQNRRFRRWRYSPGRLRWKHRSMARYPNCYIQGGYLH